MTPYQCQHCGKNVRVVNGVVMEHDWPQMFQLCPGVGKMPLHGNLLGKDINKEVKEPEDMAKKTALDGDKNCTPAAEPVMFAPAADAANDPIAAQMPLGVASAINTAAKASAEWHAAAEQARAAASKPAKRRGRICTDPESVAWEKVRDAVSGLPVTAMKRICGRMVDLVRAEELDDPVSDDSSDWMPSRQ